ncbi:oxidoreductase-like protein [Phaeosphaeriaceae sp. PMI808]|nr:oxidoreductase-like protein [Phaeosphaeriaceae sp. PMI808]
MSTQKAVVHESTGVAVLKTDVPLPKLTKDDWVLVKTKAIALNPTDWKSLTHRASPGSIVGCDYAGVVEEVGKNVTGLKVGDRIAGFVHGGDPADHTNGSGAEHIKARFGPHLKFSENLSFEDAATLGVGITTVGQGLYQALGLPFPPAKVQEPTSILIYGASTATGTLAVQYAKLSGLEVFATASPHNFDLLRKLGADHVFDYKDPEVGVKIRKASNNNIKLAYDCIAEHGSFDICGAAISSSGGRLSGLLKADSPREDVIVDGRLGYTALGETEEDREDYEFGTRFWKASADLIDSGKIRTHPARVHKGLEGVPQGLQDLKDGKVSGVKLVYTVE